MKKRNQNLACLPEPYEWIVKPENLLGPKWRVHATACVSSTGKVPHSNQSQASPLKPETPPMHEEQAIIYASMVEQSAAYNIIVKDYKESD